MSPHRFLHRIAALLVGTVVFAGASAQAAGKVDEIHIDYAYYNPVSLVLKDKGFLEDDLKKDGIKVRWVLSQGSNKALEFLNAESLDFGSTAGGAALLGRINGNPVKSIYVYSKPEWTALVTQGNSSIRTVADLPGKRIAVTRGTDPHIFLIRALAHYGLTDKDVKLVLLQHQDGRLALENGDVDAWAGLDPLMAQAEIDKGARLFYRNADANTYGILNSREDFIADHPDLVARVIAAYEKARLWAIAHPAELKTIIADDAKISQAVAARQLERTDISNPVIGERQKETILASGVALQQAGVIPPDVDVAAVVGALIELQVHRDGRDEIDMSGNGSVIGIDSSVGAAPEQGSGAARRPTIRGWGWLLGLVVPVGLALGWELAVAAGLGNGRLLPPPSRILATLSTLAVSGELALHIWATLRRVILGFFFGVAAGTGFGALTGYSTLARRLLDPRCKPCATFRRSPGCRCSSCGSASSKRRR